MSLDSIFASSLTLQAAEKLSHRELMQFPQTILSALLLSLLQSKQLLHTVHASSFEVLLHMQQIKSEHVANAIRFVISLSKQELKRVPAINIFAIDLQQWVINTRQDIAKPLYFSAPEPVHTVAAKKQIRHSSLDIAMRANARTLLATLIEAGEIPFSSIHLFRTSLKGENLIFTSDNLRSDLIAALAKIEHPAASSLIAIYRKCAADRTHQENILMNQLDSSTEFIDVLKDSPVSSKRAAMTLAEVIAERKAQFAKAKQAQEETEEQEQELLEDEQDAEESEESEEDNDFPI